MAKKVNTEKYYLTELIPDWLTKGISFDEDIYKIIQFYIFYSPCQKYAVQGRTLSYYGWKDKPWNSNKYLKSKLDSIAFQNKTKYFRVAEKMENMKTILHKAELNDDFYNNLSNERVAFLNCENAQYMSLFYHIRCAFAHSRVALLVNDNNEKILIMENGVQKGKDFLLKSRMVLKVSTLLRWIEILTLGPIEEENDYIYEILQIMESNSHITIKQLSQMFGESQYFIRKSIDRLKKSKVIKYNNYGKNGMWIIDYESKEKFLLNYQNSFKAA